MFLPLVVPPPPECQVLFWFQWKVQGLIDWNQRRFGCDERGVGDWEVPSMPWLTAGVLGER